MNIDNALMIIGPFVAFINLSAMFVYMRPKHGNVYTIFMLILCSVGLHFLMLFTGILDTPAEKYTGILFLPVNIWLFKGYPFQIVFAFFLQYQITALLTHIVEALVGITIGSDSPYALILFLALSIILLVTYSVVLLRYGRGLFERIFVVGKRSDWVLYSVGSFLSFITLISLDWIKTGPLLYFGLLCFGFWGLGVLCYTIIATNEKAAQAYQAKTFSLQIQAMQEQTESEKKHRQDMEIIRHDMRHEMGAVMELFRTGKEAEAEMVYTDWQRSLTDAIPAALCADPVLNAVFSRFERRADDKNMRLYVDSNIPGTLPIDTIKLSVMVSNALENALTATDTVTDRDKRIIRTKLIHSGTQIGFEVINPCTVPVEFDGRGLPVTHRTGHGIGVRSIAAFAADNGYLLNFSHQDGMFTMRLLMNIPEVKDVYC
ncbi:MAG: GHKL domain-containing protein [Spirochaetaceae bacterium]|jgi:hypothetical protein|nr:GHKL domain-containing protein [Spirochaetaceae bacterium]